MEIYSHNFMSVDIQYVLHVVYIMPCCILYVMYALKCMISLMLYSVYISNVTNSRAKPQQTPSVEKHAHPPSVVYCAIYSTL